MIIVDVSRVVKLYAVLLFVYLSNTGIQPCLFSAPEIFFPDALEWKIGADNQHQKNVVNWWSQFLERVLWVVDWVDVVISCRIIGAYVTERC